MSAKEVRGSLKSNPYKKNIQETHYMLQWQLSPSSAVDSVSAILDNALQNLCHILQIAKVILLCYWLDRSDNAKFERQR